MKHDLWDFSFLLGTFALFVAGCGITWLPLWLWTDLAPTSWLYFAIIAIGGAVFVPILSFVTLVLSYYQHNR